MVAAVDLLFSVEHLISKNPWAPFCYTLLVYKVDLGPTYAINSVEYMEGGNGEFSTSP